MQRVAVHCDCGAVMAAPKLRVGRVPFQESIKAGATTARHYRMDARHRGETLKGVVVAVQNELHAVLPGDGHQQSLEFEPVQDSVVRIRAMRAAGVDRGVEEKDFPR